MPRPWQIATVSPRVVESCFSMGPRESDRLAEIYSRRFDAQAEYRNKVWRVLAERFFARYIDKDATVLDLGCGYGQFINNIRCARKHAMDLNPNARGYLAPGVEFLQQDCSQPWELPADTLDVVFTSNFFEHLPSRDLLADTLLEARRCLRPGGRIIAMGPNIKYVGGAYWDFWDHHIALTERSMTEVLELQGFQVDTVIDRFLPYTMVDARPYPAALISLYLMVPLAWKLIGKQFVVMGRKPL